LANIAIKCSSKPVTGFLVAGAIVVAIVGIVYPVVPITSIFPTYYGIAITV
jgi:hypothetical protein